MFCKNCGAAVTGKFCSCCGTRVRSDLADFRLLLRRRKAAFNREKYAARDLQSSMVSSFCWDQVEMKMTRHLNDHNFDYLIPDPAFTVDAIEAAADKLYGAVMISVEALGLRQ